MSHVCLDSARPLHLPSLPALVIPKRLCLSAAEATHPDLQGFRTTNIPVLCETGPLARQSTPSARGSLQGCPTAIVSGPGRVHTRKASGVLHACFCRLPLAVCGLVCPLADFLLSPIRPNRESSFRVLPGSAQQALSSPLKPSQTPSSQLVEGILAPTRVPNEASNAICRGARLPEAWVVFISTGLGRDFFRPSHPTSVPHSRQPFFFFSSCFLPRLF